jgi:hypothetical protein
MKNASPITPVSNVIELREKYQKSLFSTRPNGVAGREEGFREICFQHVKIKSLN